MLKHRHCTTTDRQRCTTHKQRPRFQGNWTERPEQRIYSRGEVLLERTRVAIIVSRRARTRSVIAPHSPIEQFFCQLVSPAKVWLRPDAQHQPRLDLPRSLDVQQRQQLCLFALLRSWGRPWSGRRSKACFRIAGKRKNNKKSMRPEAIIYRILSAVDSRSTRLFTLVRTIARWLPIFWRNNC